MTLDLGVSSQYRQLIWSQALSFIVTSGLDQHIFYLTRLFIQKRRTHRSTSLSPLEILLTNLHDIDGPGPLNAYVLYNLSFGFITKILIALF